MKKNIIMADCNIPLLPEALLKVADVHTFHGRELRKEQLLDSNCDMLFVRSTINVDKNLLDNTNIKFVATATSGSEHLDKDYMEQNGIVYFDALGSNALSVAEYVIFSILHFAVINKIDIKNRTLGIVGFGNVGKRVAYVADKLGMNLLVSDPPLLDSDYVFPPKAIYSTLEEIFKLSDFVTIHTPLTNFGQYKTYKLIGKELLQLMKPSSLLIQSSRGGIVCEDSWMWAYDNAGISVVADVWESEPNPSRAAISKAMTATPHIAGHAFDSKLKGTMMMAEAFEIFTSLSPDYSIIESELRKCNRLSEINDYRMLYIKLSKSREILQLSEQMKQQSLRGRAKDYFEQTRKYFPMQREILPEKMM